MTLDVVAIQQQLVRYCFSSRTEACSIRDNHYLTSASPSFSSPSEITVSGLAVRLARLSA